MNYKKTLILLILFLVVTGLTVSTASAATKTTGKIYFKSNDVNKAIGNGDYVNVAYLPKGSPEGYKPNSMVIAGWSQDVGGSQDYGLNYHKLTKAKVMFSKKVNGKTVTRTKTFNFGKYDIITYRPKNGYKPKYAIITYKDI